MVNEEKTGMLEGPEGRAGGRPPRSGAKISRILRNNLTGYAFVAPALLFYAFFMLYPLFNVVRSSLHEINTLNQEATFIGLANFIELAQDAVFRRALSNTFIFAVAIIILINVPAMIFAIIIDRGRIKGNYLLRVMFFIPAILAPVLVGSAFKRIFAPFGALNMILVGSGMAFLKHTWLGIPSLAMAAVVITQVWQSAGWNMVIYFARLREIPTELYDVARIDGASELAMIRYIKIPLLSDAIAILVVLNIIGGFKVFDLIYVMTSGGPAHKTEVLTTFLYYQAFNFHRYGYASAVAVVMMVLMLLFSWLRLRGATEA